MTSVPDHDEAPNESGPVAVIEPLAWRLMLQALMSGMELLEPAQRGPSRVHRAPQPCDS